MNTLHLSGGGGRHIILKGGHSILCPGGPLVLGLGRIQCPGQTIFRRGGRGGGGGGGRAGGLVVL